MEGWVDIGTAVSVQPVSKAAYRSDFQWKTQKVLLGVIRRWLSSRLIDWMLCVGYYSWRSAWQGSWFVQALAAELGKSLSSSEEEVDFARVLMKVTQRVATEFQSKTPLSRMSSKKQVPSVYSTLTKEIHFPRPTTAWFFFHLSSMSRPVIRGFPNISPSIGDFFRVAQVNRSHYKVMHYSAIDRKIVAVKKFSSDAWRTATWELRRCVPVESFRFERRWPEKLGCRRWKV